ncbi:TRAP transporter small permease subunit [Acidimangrovimonas sediminis]|uniref:TRAP transporter small permease subunit n=1 Tax=Acidimangrovimonas sediminis TaxID=2056283 RepID=UPI000C7FCC5A|nr:TRAP transporter small permease [Acidimangrovimonas sediminis]
MKALTTLSAWIFGLAMIGLAFFVTADVIARKFFSFSFEGTGEMGGYILAVGAELTFVVALTQRAHMRIDVLYARLPVALRAVLDWVSLVTLAAMALLMAMLGWQMLRDSISYHSTAQTPWATPLAWPQSFWLASLALFALVALWQLALASRALVARRWEELNARFGSAGEKDEIEAELADLERRR